MDATEGFAHVGKLYEGEEEIADAALRSFVRTSIEARQPSPSAELRDPCGHGSGAQPVPHG